MIVIDFVKNLTLQIVCMQQCMICMIPKQESDKKYAAGCCMEVAHSCVCVCVYIEV